MLTRSQQHVDHRFRGDLRSGKKFVKAVVISMKAQGKVSLDLQPRLVVEQARDADWK